MGRFCGSLVPVKDAGAQSVCCGRYAGGKQGRQCDSVRSHQKTHRLHQGKVSAVKTWNEVFRPGGRRLNPAAKSLASVRFRKIRTAASRKATAFQRQDLATPQPFRTPATDIPTPALQQQAMACRPQTPESKSQSALSTRSTEAFTAGAFSSVTCACRSSRSAAECSRSASTCTLKYS